MSHIYIPAHQYQLAPGTGPTGGFDCQAYATAMAVDRATIGGTIVTGREVRLASDEPIPDKHSPGLNLKQIVAVSAKWHVEIENRTGDPWSAAVTAWKQRRAVICDGDYDQIPDRFSGQPSFDGPHAVLGNHLNAAGDAVWILDPINKKGGYYLPIKYLRAYMEKLAKSEGITGLFWATTRITPSLA